MEVAAVSTVAEGHKRKATAAYPTRPKKARTDAGRPLGLPQTEEGVHTDSSDDEYDDVPKASGNSTPLTEPSGRATPNPNWPSLQKTIVCPFEGCSKTFNRQAKLEDHIRSHTNERPFVCSEDGCDKSFTRKTHLNRHLKSAHQDERNFVCSFDGCGKAFGTGTRLRRHEAQHINREQYTCSECGQEFRKNTTLQRHVDTEHKGKKAYYCQHILEDGSVCNAGFNQTYALKNHQSRTHNEKRYWCDICAGDGGSNGDDEQLTSTEEPRTDFAFATYGEYQLHCKEVHPPMCDMCGIACTTGKLLVRHKELEHGIVSVESSDKPVFTCPEPGCNREFGKKGNLDVHIRSVHAKQRPFVCGSMYLSELNHVEGWDGHGACGRDFKAKSQLEEHIRTAHLGLQNRMKARKLAKAAAHNSRATPVAPPSNPILDRLTGTTLCAAHAKSFRCHITGCTQAFEQEFECEVHMQRIHGIDPYAEDDDSPLGRHADPLELGYESFNPAIASTDIDHDDPDYGLDLIRELEDNARQGGAFWLGGDSADNTVAGLTHEKGTSTSAEDREREDMHRLIGSGHGWEDNIIVDPALRDA